MCNAKESTRRRQLGQQKKQQTCVSTQSMMTRCAWFKIPSCEFAISAHLFFLTQLRLPHLLLRIVYPALHLLCLWLDALEQTDSVHETVYFSVCVMQNRHGHKIPVRSFNGIMNHGRVFRTLIPPCSHSANAHGDQQQDDGRVRHWRYLFSPGDVTNMVG